MAATTSTYPHGTRERLIDSLHAPIARIVKAADAAGTAWNVRDLDRVDRAMRKLDTEITAYLRQIEERGDA
jgi:hypothetical protein